MYSKPPRCSSVSLGSETAAAVRPRPFALDVGLSWRGTNTCPDLKTVRVVVVPEACVPGRVAAAPHRLSAAGNSAAEHQPAGIRGRFGHHSTGICEAVAGSEARSSAMPTWLMSIFLP